MLIHIFTSIFPDSLGIKYPRLLLCLSDYSCRYNVVRLESIDIQYSVPFGLGQVRWEKLYIARPRFSIPSIQRSTQIVSSGVCSE